MRKINGMIPTSYEQANALIDKSGIHHIAKNTTLLRDGTLGGDLSVKLVLHHTPVVTFYADGRIVLNAGGWQTPTTMARMNAALAERGCKIIHRNGQWRVWYPATKLLLSYYDGVTFGVAK